MIRPLALTLLLLATPAGAAEIPHRVAPEETLEDIAVQVYGDPERAGIIQLFNALRSLPAPAGTELRLPLADEHTVRAGESWSTLALRYWGSASLRGDLAELAGAPGSGPLRVGQKVRIPVLIPYRLDPGETLASVSRRFYGSTRRAGLLARLNEISDPHHLRVGFPVRVPVTGLVPVTRASAAPTTNPERPAVAAPLPARDPGDFEAPLRRAINAYLEGQYAVALQLLEALRPGALATGSPIEQELLLRYLIFVYTAYERVEEACNGYRALSLVTPRLTWDRDQVSPKILDLISRCDRL